MSDSGQRLIELEEERVAYVPADFLAPQEGMHLHRRYPRQLEIGFPGPISGPWYQLRSRGYVGQFPVGRRLQIRVRPKVPLRNLFGMLEWVYQLGSFHLEKEAIETEAIGELFERLVGMLAARVLERLHRGLFQDYVERVETLTCARGRILFPGEPGESSLCCRFPEQTPDLEDNQILVWTLYQLQRYPFQREEVRRQVCQAFRGLAGVVSLIPIPAARCAGREYHRLNQDYRSLHALCRLILESSGPGLESGAREFIPFAVPMPLLFESFVAEWLRAHLDFGLVLHRQQQALLEGSTTLFFRIDLSLEERDSGRCLAVLDTKYKTGQRIEEEDVQQVVAYAVRMAATRAFLVYPTASNPSRVLRVGPIEVRTLGFDLGGDLEEAGGRLVEQLREGLSGALP